MNPSRIHDRPRPVPALALVALALTSLVAVAPGGAAAGEASTSAAVIQRLLEQGSAKACTTTLPSCQFQCEIGDTIFVAASGSLLLSADGICGGREAYCSSYTGGFCSAESEKTVPQNDTGICEGRQIFGNPTISCAAARRTG